MSEFYYKKNQVLDDTGWDIGPAPSKVGWIVGLLLIAGLSVFGYFYTQSQKNIEQLKETIVYVKTDAGVSSGFLISPSGDVLTSKKILGDPPEEGDLKIEVVCFPGTDESRDLTAEIISTGHYAVGTKQERSVEGDWVHVRLKDPPDDLRHLNLMGPDTVISEGDEVHALGFPFGSDDSIDQRGPKVSVTTGTVTEIDKQHDRASQIHHSALLDEGMRGGPLVLKGSLTVIGINSVTSDDGRVLVDQALPIRMLPSDVLERSRP